MKNIVLILLIALGLSGCKKWLEEAPKSVITTNQYYKTQQDAQSAVNGLYYFLYPPFTGGGRNYSYAMLELVTGQFRTVSEGNDLVNVYNLRQNSASPLLQQWFTSAYQGIEAANLVIANVPNISMDAALKKSMVGEAKFLRAYYYYTLVNIFGDVPLKLKPTASAADGLIPKTAVKDIYEQAIVPDLQDAESSGLAATPAGSGRASTGAAKALLAKVYLSMAGFPVAETDKYALARDKAKEVIDGGDFHLFQSDGSLTWFNKLNNPDFDNKEENIFSINFGLDIVNNILPIELYPKGVSFNRNGYVNNDMGLLYPETGFLSSYDPADLRRQENGFFYDTINVDGTKYSFPWSLYKFFDKNLLDKAPRSGKDFPLIRYADVLLTYAEAQNEADGSPNTDAFSAVNGIRSRAGLPALSGLSQADFRTAVWKERIWELCAENKAWYDIVRTHKIFDATNGLFVDAVGFVLPSGATFQSANLKFPIPLSEVQVNPLLK
ncbi:RagB/SusD family nutrient uptake outer membrane protein [Flavitalea sp. BT771]|uniref:RagB/SusD family nutrient uptake outer membrane protein n=1 Tax=Flavitalea sp. BT771 TaxID=3063329 RepID=UPI0026E48BC4|nr:RagB/SusD family nutrient uptake outer membrane protein [Flavitalea sp. BT771]MDO6432199.1 RagB/SusD family nutrient uptake outer membrane protein [Flavitalea sp. BT771]MDV6221109.1 RagB/SusD family nutrient uptake outer membrane protein [Flavitalea sp. BT771]